MSVIDTESLKSNSDTNLIFDTRPEAIGVAQIRHDTLLEFGKFTSKVKITNNDVINSLTYRTKSPSAPLRTVPPSSDVEVPEWTSYIEVNPNAVTGNGILEMDLVTPENAQR